MFIQVPLAAAIALVAGVSISGSGPGLRASARVSARGPVRSLALSPDGKLLAIGLEGGSIQLAYTESGAIRASLEGHTTAVTALAFIGSDGLLLVSGSRDGTVRQWHTASASERSRWVAHESEVSAIALSPLGDRLVTASSDGAVRVWDPSGAGSKLQDLQEDAPVLAVAVPAGGKQIAVGAAASELFNGRATNLTLWDPSDGRLIRRLVGHRGDVTALAYSPDGTVLAAAFKDGSVRVHGVGPNNGEGMAVLGTHEGGGARAVAYRGDGKLVASGGDDGTLRFFDTDLERERPEGRTRAHAGGVVAFALSRDGRVAASAGKDGAVVIWDGSPLLAPTTKGEVEQGIVDGVAILDAKDAKRAVPHFQSLAQKFPNDARVRFLLARAWIEAGDLKPALPELEAAVRVDPKNVSAANLLGMIQLEMKQTDQGIKNLKAAVEANPNVTGAMTRLGALHTSARRFETGAKYFWDAYQIEPSNPTHAYNLACNDSLRGRSDQALAWLERALQLGFDNFDGIKRDTDLDPIRTLPRFQQLLATWGAGKGATASGGDPAKAGRLRDEAKRLKDAKQFAAAADTYDKALAEERATAKPREDMIRTDLFWSAFCRRELEQWEAALAQYEEVLRISDRMGASDQIQTFALTLAAGIHRRLERHEKAVQYYERVIPTHLRANEPGLAAVAYKNIADAYKAWGKFDRALENYQKAAELHEKTGDKDGNLAPVLAGIAEIYKAWNQTPKALEMTKRALELARKRNKPDELLPRLSDLALINSASGDLPGAVKAYEEYLSIAQRLNLERQTMLGYNGLAAIYVKWKKKDEALKASESALAIARKSSIRISVVTTFVAAAYVHMELGIHDKAEALYAEGVKAARGGSDESLLASVLTSQASGRMAAGRAADAIAPLKEALEIHRRRNALPGVLGALKDLGRASYDLERYAEAAQYLTQAVQLAEQLRATASGEARRDYLSREIWAYELLILANMGSRDPYAAFTALEKGRAKLLAERLAGGATSGASAADAVALPSMAELVRMAGDAGAILLYSNVTWRSLGQIVIDREGLTAQARGNQELVRAAMGKYGTLVAATIEKQRGVKKKPGAGGPDSETAAVEPGHEEGLENVIAYYRTLLQQPSAENRQRARELGRMLYDFLIKPNEPRLKGKTDLLIVPDGVLAFLPFETLIDGSGKYLADTYRVRYVQSLSVLGQIQRRSFPADRKPMLAFGGAVYDPVRYATDMVRSEGQLAMLELEAASAMKNRGSVRNSYAALGLASWENLPGTLGEVKGLASIVPGADLITGGDVDEQRVKQLSKRGELRRYRVLHFATHGLVVPEVPELSALVLSQFKEERGGEDGYLRMGEISELQLAADFVNLSACETGLGKIYGGEGVVGLAQAFLIAGANGLSVSLWKVADQSTAKFMQEVTKLVQSGRADWSGAIAEVKRRFIRGELGGKLSDPYYWAPFVYYGR